MTEIQQEQFNIINLYNSNDLDLNKNLKNVVLNYDSNFLNKNSFLTVDSNNGILNLKKDSFYNFKLNMNPFINLFGRINDSAMIYLEQAKKGKKFKIIEDSIVFFKFVENTSVLFSYNNFFHKGDKLRITIRKLSGDNSIYTCSRLLVDKEQKMCKNAINLRILVYNQINKTF